MSVTTPRAFDHQGYNSLSLARKVELKRYARVMTQSAATMRQLTADLQQWVTEAVTATEEAIPTKGEHDE